MLPLARFLLLHPARTESVLQEGSLVWSYALRWSWKKLMVVFSRQFISFSRKLLWVLDSYCYLCLYTNIIRIEGERYFWRKICSNYCCRSHQSHLKDVLRILSSFSARILANYFFLKQKRTSDGANISTTPKDGELHKKNPTNLTNFKF